MEQQTGPRDPYLEDLHSGWGRSPSVTRCTHTHTHTQNSTEDGSGHTATLCVLPRVCRSLLCRGLPLYVLTWLAQAPSQAPPPP